MRAVPGLAVAGLALALTAPVSAATATSGVPATRSTPGDLPVERSTAEPGPAPDVLLGVGGPAALDPDVTEMLDRCDPGLEVVAGRDRWTTATMLADRRTTDDTVVLASGEAFPDALAAAPLVAERPLLLTARDALPEPTRRWLEDHEPAQVVVLGGPAAVGEQVVEEVEEVVDAVRRIAGADRFATAERIAYEGGGGDRVFVVSGRSFADALAVTPVAAREAAPILLTERDSLPAATATALSTLDPSEVVVVGGTTVVAESVTARIRELVDGSVRRVAGADRYATAAAVADEVPDGPGVVVASGAAFPDALAAGPLAAELGAPLLLLGEDLHPDVAAELERRRDLECRPVTVRPSEVEGLTLGPSARGHVELTASVDGLSVPIRDARRGATLLLPGAATVTMAYPEPAAGVTAVTWDELLDPTQRTLVVEQPWRRQRPAPPQDLTVAWQYTGDSQRYRAEVAAAPGLTVTAPFRYFLADDGTLRLGADTAFIADMHDRGVEVWPTVHTGGAEAIEASLSDGPRRAEYAQRIADDAQAAGADGVNIDIEGFADDLRDEITDFTRLLSDAVHQWGGVTSFDLTSMTDEWATPPPGFEFWSTAPDRRSIAEAVDYSVLMAYDQFNRYRPRGPVASDAWVDEALRYQLRFSDPEQVLLGLPLYARVWRGDVPSAVGQERLKELIEGRPREPDPAFGVDRVVTTDGRVTWAETSDRLVTRLAMVERYGLAGTASWRLGFDDPATWATLGRHG